MPSQSYSPIPNDTYANFETYFERMDLERQSRRHDSSSSSAITLPVRARTASQNNADRIIRHSPNSSESRLLSTHTPSSESDSPKGYGYAMDRPDSPDLGSSAAETIPLYSSPTSSAGATNNHTSPRLASSRTFVSSPLNPSSPPPQSHSPSDSPYGKVFESFGKTAVTRRPSEEARALGHRPRSSTSSMILYRLVDVSDDSNGLPAPPRFGDLHSNRSSISSISGETVVSVSYDSKYPSGPSGGSVGGIVAYAYDPTLDTEDLEDDDWKKEDLEVGSRGVSGRGLRNVTALSIVLLMGIGLFLVLPLTYQRHDYRNDLITHNPFVNSTGQAEDNIVRRRR